MQPSQTIWPPPRISLTHVRLDEHGAVTGTAWGDSASEVLRNIAATATEQQARLILQRLGTVSYR